MARPHRNINSILLGNLSTTELGARFVESKPMPLVTHAGKRCSRPLDERKRRRAIKRARKVNRK